ncbi:MAG: class I SAM-dependent methyltransferase [Myxococcales bacterium]
MDGRERALEEAFDGQAARFERAPVQTDPVALARMVEFAALAADSRVLDAGCGPGLVAEAFLAAGHRVHGVDLAGEMVRRARERCARFGGRARFEQGAVSGFAPDELFDAAVSRFVVHHASDPVAFLRAKTQRVRPGGVVVASDHVTDPDGPPARWHQDIERARDRTHERNLTPGELADAFGRAGLVDVQLAEDGFELDFDEWFDRGTPGLPKAEVRARVLAGRARGFDARARPDGGITIRCIRVLVRGVR